MRKVEAAAEQTAHVAPEVVWSLLSDVMVYPQWGPWRKAGYRSEGDAAANGKGAVYWLEGSKRYGFRYPVSVEEILDVEPGKRLAYTVLRGIPVRNYRAEVTLTPSPDGTLIRWGAWWDRTILGRLVYRSLRNLYLVIVAALVKAAEGPPELNANLSLRRGAAVRCHPGRDISVSACHRHVRSSRAGGSDSPALPNDQLCAVQTGHPEDGVVAHNEPDACARMWPASPG